MNTVELAIAEERLDRILGLMREKLAPLDLDVVLSRVEGATWKAIGARHGLSGERARQRFWKSIGRIQRACGAG